MPSLGFAFECLKTAFGRFRAEVGPSLSVGLGYLALSLGLQSVAAFRFWPGRLAAIIGVLLFQGLVGILMIGLARFFLSLSDQKSPRFLELFDGFRAPWKILAGTLFGWLIGTLVLLIVLILGRAPLALFLLLGLLPLVMFGPFLIADGAVSQVAEAFLEAFRLGVANYSHSLAVAILVVGLIEIGALLILGTLVSIPLCYTMTAVAYRSLVPRAE